MVFTVNTYKNVQVLQVTTAYKNVKPLTCPQSPLISSTRVAFAVFVNFEFKSSFSLRKIISFFSFSEKKNNFWQNATKMLE